MTPMTEKGKMHVTDIGWHLNNRGDTSGAAVRRAYEFAATCDEIQSTVLRDGPWATAIRLTEPFTGRPQ